jgi:hypothetical protein
MSKYNKGPAARELLIFLKKEGVLKSFVTQCHDFEELLYNVENRTDRRSDGWNPSVGGFLWAESNEGRAFWAGLNTRFRTSVEDNDDE